MSTESHEQLWLEYELRDPSRFQAWLRGRLARRPHYVSRHCPIAQYLIEVMALPGEVNVAATREHVRIHDNLTSGLLAEVPAAGTWVAEYVDVFDKTYVRKPWAMAALKASDALTS